MEIYESGEMYLETILELQKQQGNVRSVDIVNAMGHAKSSVSEGIKQLAEGGYVNINEFGYITFTEKGNKLANIILERHIVLSNYFQKIGVSKETADKDACRIEHIISDETFEKIKEHAKLHYHKQ